jgi:hypothetical protein
VWFPHTLKMLWQTGRRDPAIITSKKTRRSDIAVKPTGLSNCETPLGITPSGGSH